MATRLKILVGCWKIQYNKEKYLKNGTLHRDIFMEVTHQYPDNAVHLTLFRAAIAEGKPRKLEHNDIRWITVDEISQYDFCPADQTILKGLLVKKL